METNSLQCSTGHRPAKKPRALHLYHSLHTGILPEGRRKNSIKFYTILVLNFFSNSLLVVMTVILLNFLLSIQFFSFY